MGSSTLGRTSASEKIHREALDSADKAKDMAMTGDTDKDFAAIMAEHHRSGNRMAQEYINSGHNQELKDLAQQMIDDNNQELRTLERHS